MSRHPVPSRESHRDSRDAKVRQIFATAKEKSHKFSTVSVPIVDNFSGASRNSLQDNAPRKIQTFRGVIKHGFSQFFRSSPSVSTCKYSDYSHISLHASQ